MEQTEDKQQVVKPTATQAPNLSEGNNGETIKPTSNHEKNFEREKEKLWQSALPNEFKLIENYLNNDNFLSNEEISSAIAKEKIDLQKPDKKNEHIQLLAEGTQPSVILSAKDLIVDSNENKIDKKGTIVVDPVELSKIQLEPSFLFAKDEKSDIKVITQEPESKKYEFKDINNDDYQKYANSRAIPKIFTNDGVLEAFLTSFFIAKSTTELVLNNTGNKVGDYINGKIDLLLVNAKDGYPASEKKAAEILAPVNNKQDDFKQTNTELTQPKKEDINMQNDVKTKFNESEVKWNELEKVGVSKERLQVTGQLQKFLNGERTSLIDPSSIKDGNKYLLENTPFALKLKAGANGPESHMLFKENKLNIPDMYEGQKLSVEDKVNLLTKNHLGRTINIEGKSHFLSVDKDLNQLSSREVDSIKIPSKIKLANGGEINLTKDQQQLLSQGKPAVVADLLDNKNQPFTGHLIVNAASGKMDIMKEVSPTMTQTISNTQDKNQVLQNNESARVKRNPEQGKGLKM